MEKSDPTPAPQSVSRATRTRSRRSQAQRQENPHSLIPLIAQTTPTPCSVSRAALLHMNLHALLCEAEVIGWLAGEKHGELVKVVKAFQVKAQGEMENPGMNVEMDPLAALEVQDLISTQGLQIVGWYHSHPRFANTPSLQDIDSQVKQQQGAQGNFLGAIVSPFWNTSLPPLCLFTVEEDLDHLSTYHHFPPCAVRFSLYGDLGREVVLSTARELIGLYSEHPQRVSLDSVWNKGKTYGEKVRCSAEQLVGPSIAEEICHMLYQAWGDELAPIKQRKTESR